MKFATKPVPVITRHTLSILLHYLEKLKIQIFCKFSGTEQHSEGG